MSGPIADRQFLRDQSIRSDIVGNAQQRLGNAHERNALLIGQAEFLQKRIEERALVAPGARPLDQRHGATAR